MTINPWTLDVQVPDSEHTLEIPLGLTWGGDATKGDAEAERRFARLALNLAEKAILIDRALLEEVLADCEPEPYERLRYRGGASLATLKEMLEDVNAEAGAAFPEIRPRALLVVLSG